MPVPWWHNAARPVSRPGDSVRTLPLLSALVYVGCGAAPLAAPAFPVVAQQNDDLPATRQPVAEPAGADNIVAPASSPRAPKPVVVDARPWLYNKQTREAHSLPEVDGPQITVTKKTSVELLDAQPTIIDNHERELFDRLPGIVLAEQQNPTQLNVAYRGLGNPQESEYVLLLQDGLPLELDWIGFPTTYYLPVPQTLSAVQMLRGGSGLLYGPEPQPAINFLSRQAGAATPLAGTTEQVGGSNGLFSSFNRVSGTSGRWDYLADFSHRAADGERANGGYDLDAGDLRLGYRLDDRQSLQFNLHAYDLTSGLAGLMSHAQFQADPERSTTPADRLATSRYTAALTYRNRFSERGEFVQKLWTGYTDLRTRSDSYAGAELAPQGATLSQQRFHYTGLDGRLVEHWGRGNALTVGYTAYGSASPWNEFLDPGNPYVSPYDRGGIPFYAADRKTRYGAVFAENVFRFPGFHVVASARLDHEELSIEETAAPHPNLVGSTYRKDVPLFGLGVGNDFGRGNETYLNVSQGFRPLRYLDIASPFSNFSTTNNPDPTRYLTFEGGVHGWPVPGLYYDASLFQVNVRDRIESRAYSQTETVDVNTGDTRNRGLEFEISYDVLRLGTGAPDRHLDLFLNGSFLDAQFTRILVPGQVGKTPAYAPHYVVKAGATWRADRRFKVSLIADAVGAQFFQDSNVAVAGTPAQIPAYFVADLSADWTFANRWRLLGGVSNLGDRRYYSRVFLFGGSLEPANRRAGYLGIAYDF